MGSRPLTPTPTTRVDADHLDLSLTRDELELLIIDAHECIREHYRLIAETHQRIEEYKLLLSASEFWTFVS